MDLGRSFSLSHEFSQWKFTRSLLPHPHFQSPHGPDLRSSEFMESRREGGGVCLWWEEPRGAICMAALALPTEIEFRGNTGAAQSQVFFPQEELDPLWSCRHRNTPWSSREWWFPPALPPAAGLDTTEGLSQGCDSLCDGWNQSHAGSADASKKHQPKISCPDRALCWWPKPCYFHPNLASSPLAPGCWQLSPKQSPEECHLKWNPKITHTASTLQSPHLLNELPPSSTQRGTSTDFPQLLEATEPDKLIVFCWACMIYLLYTGGQDEK